MRRSQSFAVLILMLPILSVTLAWTTVKPSMMSHCVYGQNRRQQCTLQILQSSYDDYTQQQLSRQVSRRKLLQGSIATAALFPLPAHADRRQLELCLVNVIRVMYWAQDMVNRLSASSIEQRQQLYLEARAGCKSALTGRLSGYANNRVYILSTLQLQGCLKDLEYYASSASSFKASKALELRRDFVESIAAVVEFDGMDTLTDPSPRTSLTIGQFSSDKCNYVQRLLAEKVVPTGRALLQLYPDNAIQKSLGYIQQYYPSEITEL